MKKEKVKKTKLSIEIDLPKHQPYHFVNSLSNVFFPYQPYKQQIEIVGTIQKAISKGQNALIQSPTGTGKTLCLLIGALSSLVDSNSRKKIFYLTRTHSQISQVVSQFKKTSYQCNMNIIASREHLCINHNLQHLKGKNLQKACEQMCSQKLCPYKEFSTVKIPKQPLDLQKFKQNCRKQLICGYFYSKQLTQKCELTVLPFNYFLDWNLFQKNSIDIKDSVVIFDEAHNIDSLCQQGSNIRMTSDLLFQTISQLKALIKAQSKKFLLQKFRQKSEEAQETQQFKQQVQQLLNKIKLINSSQIFSKQDLLHFLQEYTTTSKQQGVDLGNYKLFISRGKKIERTFMKKQMACQNFHTFLSVFQRFFNIINYDEEYQKFAISLTKQQLLFRCLDASLCFARLINAKPRTIILSSGTLGDLNSWQKNLKISFPQKISAQSFITSNQLYAQIKCKSQNGINFNFGFQNKQNQLQYEQIAKQLKILQKIITGGIVVAFSTYELLQKTLRYCSILEKKVFFQTKGGNVEDIYKQYQNSLRQSTSFMFIVIKGRFSEGINFQGQLCRCLVVIGIPFLPLKDPAVVEKMKYIENNFSRAEADEWYSIQSFKALNQTLGRAIRNKNDYAIILLLDQRYAKEEYIKKFSSWFSKCLRNNKCQYNSIKQFLKQSPWISNQLQNKPFTKNKKQPTICQRLQEFSTPTKSNTNKRKLKLVFQSNKEPQKSKKSNEEITLIKEIKVPQDYQLSYKQMKQQHFEYFVNFTPKQQNYKDFFEKQSQQQTEDSEQKDCKGKIIKVMSSYGKYRNVLDF